MTRIVPDEPRSCLNRHLQWTAFNQRPEMPFSVKDAELR